MDNRRLLQNSIDYIEANLKTELTAQELADIAGFSLFHYYRLFQQAVGMPVMQYITRRRLLHAIREIGQGRRMIDAALEYGFDTHAGFYKAFSREFGHAPSAFLKKYRIRRPYKPNLLQEEHIIMSHKRIREMLRYWGLENETVTDIFYYGNGEQNENAYYIGENHVLKFTANLGTMKKHIELSKALAAAGLCAAVPVLTADGREYVEEGDTCFYLSERLDGEQMSPVGMYENDYPAKARFIGEIVGQLHGALEKMDAVVNETDLLESVKGWALPRSAELLGLSERFCADYLAALEVLYPKLKKQIIHRDPNPGNIILHGEKWGFIDFELSERNVRLYDPCYAASGILSETFTELDEEKRQKWLTIYQNIMIGYDSTAHLSEAERKAVPYILLANQFVCLAWFSEQETMQEHFAVNKAMTRWLIENFDALKL